MPDIDTPDMPAFVRLARLLDAGLFTDVPSSEFKTLVPRSDGAWEALFTSARDNRALAPLAYIFATRRAFGALAGAEERAAMQEWHEALAVRASEIRDQIVELGALFAQHGQRLVLLKGAARLFDGLYPDISCRYSIDIDPLIEDPEIFYKTFEIGYQAYQSAEFDMKAINAGDISAAAGPAFHHLPPLFRDGCQASVELHTRPFISKYEDLAIPTLWQHAKPVEGQPGLLIPSVPHQIVINIVHTLFHGLAKDRFNLSLRDLFEGHLLYTRASDAERDQVAAHFSDRGYNRDFDLWRSVCFRVFGHPLYKVRETGFHDRFFARLVITQSDPGARFRFRLLAKFKELIFLELWNRQRLRKRLRHLASADFWRRVMGHFRQSRQGRK